MEDVWWCAGLGLILWGTRCVCVCTCTKQVWKEVFCLTGYLEKRGKLSRPLKLQCFWNSGWADCVVPQAGAHRCIPASSACSAP